MPVRGVKIALNPLIRNVHMCCFRILNSIQFWSVQNLIMFVVCDDLIHCDKFLIV